MSHFQTMARFAGYGEVPSGASVAGTDPNMSASDVSGAGSQGLCVRPENVVFPWEAPASTVSLVSASAADSSTGTGVRSVLIQGLDTDGVSIQEVVATNGTTPVLTQQTFGRINQLVSLTVGTGGENAGEITATMGGSVIVSIPATGGISLSSHFSVPMNWVRGALVTRAWAIIASKNSASIVTRARIRGPGGPWLNTTSLAASNQSGEVQHFFEAEVRIPSGGDLDLGVIDMDGNNIGVSAGFDLVRLL